MAFETNDSKHKRIPTIEASQNVKRCFICIQTVLDRLLSHFGSDDHSQNDNCESTTVKTFNEILK